MKENDKIIVIGCGGHARSVVDSILQLGEYEIAGFINDTAYEYRGIEVIGNDDMLPEIYENGIKKAVLGVGFVGKGNTRKRLVEMLESIGFELPCIIDETAKIAADVKLGKGVFIGKNAVVNSNVTLGDMCIINTNAVIEHDCTIGEYTHVAVSATICGEVNIGKLTFVGASSTVIQHIAIGDNVLVGADTLVLKDINDNEKVYNNRSMKCDDESKTLIIAEAGVNHNGDILLAKKLIDAAKEAGADIVKFQTFNSKKLTSRFAKKAEYQKKTTDKDESQLDMLKKLELSREAHFELIDYCNQKGIKFLSTPFDIDSIKLLDELGMDIFKVPSGEITNYPYLREIGKLGKKVILSTGMSTMEEVVDAICVLKENGAKSISVLHCNTQYPTPFEDVNLAAMYSLANKTGLEYGYSDHTVGIEVPVAAVAMGATIIEKHFTLDKTMEGPDHKASLDPKELKDMVSAIRNIERARGNGEKRVTESEKGNITVVRKSIVASKSIKKGEIFTEENITTKRPGNGISPMKWNEILGQSAIRDFDEDELIEM